MACRELIYFIMVFIMGYRAVSVLMPEASSPSSSLTLVSVEFPLTCSHSSVLGALLPQCLVFFFFCCIYSFHLPKYVVPKVLPPSLMGLTLTSCRSVWELAGIGTIGPGGIFSQKPLTQPLH